jgi:hypothetical protein
VGAGSADADGVDVRERAKDGTSHESRDRPKDDMAAGNRVYTEDVKTFPVGETATTG